MRLGVYNRFQGRVVKRPAGPRVAGGGIARFTPDASNTGVNLSIFNLFFLKVGLQGGNLSIYRGVISPCLVVIPLFIKTKLAGLGGMRTLHNFAGSADGFAGRRYLNLTTGFR